MSDAAQILTQNFRVVVGGELEECGQHLSDGLELRGWVLVSAQIGDGPSDVAKEGGADSLPNQTKKRLDNSLTGDHVSKGRAIASNVAKSPNGLLANILAFRAQELDEVGNCTGANNLVRLLRCLK